MNPVVQFLTENPVVYFASCDKNHHPRVRPFQFMFEKDGKLYFCTSNKKKVYREIHYNPTIELSTSTADSRWIRVSGRVTFCEDMELKKRILDENPQVKAIYQTPENPDLALFYLISTKAEISDFSGNPPQEFTL